MRLCLTGIYGDGSNVAHLKDAILLERWVTLVGPQINEIFAALEALEAGGQHAHYVVIIRPDEERA